MPRAVYILSITLVIATLARAHSDDAESVASRLAQSARLDAFLETQPNTTKAHRWALDEKNRTNVGSGQVHFLALGDWGASIVQSTSLCKFEVATMGWSSNPNCGTMHFRCAREPNSFKCDVNGKTFDRESYAQNNVAKWMQHQSADLMPTAVLNVGDSFYWSGVQSTYDPRWHLVFESMYRGKGMNVPWLGILGNHDYGGDCCDRCLFGGGISHSIKSGCSQAQIDYDDEKDWQWPQKRSSRWVMPSRYYSKQFDFGDLSIDVFMLDTVAADITKQCGHNGCHCPKARECGDFLRNLWREQKEWFTKALAASKADWKFVVGHHPPEFPGVMDIIHLMNQHHAQIYFTGHVHQLRHDIVNGIDVVVTGAGGGFQWAGGNTGNTKWGGGFDYGFNTISVGKSLTEIKYISDEGRELYSFTTNRAAADKVVV